MKRRKPSIRRVNEELRKLRTLIEYPEQDPLKKRLAQVAEDAIRWVTEETDWNGPVDDVEVFAKILHREGVYRYH